jgi:transposase
MATAPAELREQLRGLSTVRLVQATATLELGPVTTPLAAARLSVRTLAHRYPALSAELRVLDAELDRLTAMAAPKLEALFGVGSDSAGALLVAAGDNPRSAALGCGVLNIVRGLADPGVLGQDPPAPAQSGW